MSKASRSAGVFLPACLPCLPVQDAQRGHPRLPPSLPGACTTCCSGVPGEITARHTDCVVCSLRPASARSAELGLPYREGLVKNRYVGRTFIMPDQRLREVRPLLGMLGTLGTLLWRCWARWARCNGAAAAAGLGGSVEGPPAAARLRCWGATACSP